MWVSRIVPGAGGLALGVGCRRRRTRRPGPARRNSAGGQCKRRGIECQVLGASRTCAQPPPGTFPLPRSGDARSPRETRARRAAGVGGPATIHVTGRDEVVEAVLSKSLPYALAATLVGVAGPGATGAGARSGQAARRLHGRGLGRAQRAAQQLRSGHLPDARWLPVDRRLRRRGPLRWRAHRLLAAAQSAGPHLRHPQLQAGPPGHALADLLEGDAGLRARLRGARLLSRRRPVARGRTPGGRPPRSRWHAPGWQRAPGLLRYLPGPSPRLVPVATPELGRDGVHPPRSRRPAVAGERDRDCSGPTRRRRQQRRRRRRHRSFVPASDGKGPITDPVRAYFETPQGRLWFLYDRGLLRIEGDQVRMLPEGQACRYGRGNQVIEDRDGNVWIGTRSGLTRFRDGQWVSYTTRDGLPDNDATTLFEDREGSLWVGTRSGGIAQFTDRVVTANAGTAQPARQPVDRPASARTAPALTGSGPGLAWCAGEPMGVTATNSCSPPVTACPTTRCSRSCRERPTTSGWGRREDSPGSRATRSTSHKRSAEQSLPCTSTVPARSGWDPARNCCASTRGGWRRWDSRPRAPSATSRAIRPARSGWRPTWASPG